MNDLRPLPIKISVASSPFLHNKSQEDTLKGHVIRTSLKAHTTVSAFMKSFLLTRKPCDLWDLILSMKKSSSKVAVRFGGEESNEFTVIVKEQGSGSASKQSDRSNTEKTDLVLSLFLREGDDNSVCMTHPADDLYEVLEGCDWTKGPVELCISPSNLWQPSIISGTNTTSEATITLIVNKNELHQVISGNHDASIVVSTGEDEEAVSHQTKQHKQSQQQQEQQQEQQQKRASSMTNTNDVKASKKRKKKDPNAPKAKRSAFLFFLTDERSQINKSMPDANFSEISKILGAKWKNLDPERKKVYEDMAIKDKERFENQMKNYVVPDENGHEESKASTTGTGTGKATTNSATTYATNTVDVEVPNKKKAKKDPSKPKGPRNIYWYFCSERRPILAAETPTLDFQAFNIKLSSAYKELSESERKKFQDMADEDKKRFEREMELYRNGVFTGTVASKKGDEEAEQGAKATVKEAEEGQEEEEKGKRKRKESKHKKKEKKDKDTKKATTSKTTDSSPKKQSRRKLMSGDEQESTPRRSKRASGKL